MMFTAQQIAALIDGTVEGDPEASVNTFTKIEEGKPNALSFLANEKYEEFLYTSKSSVIIISHKLELTQKVDASLIRVANPYEAFAILLQKYEALKPRKTGREAPIFIGENSTVGSGEFLGAFVRIGSNSSIGENTTIHPNVTVGDNVKIGDNVIIHPNTTIYNDCVIGNSCTIHAGTVIGSDGFGFAPNSENQYNKIPQIGNTILENHVEIGSNCAIDRATMGSTILRKGVKLDNFIQIAHNVEIGENTVIASQSGVAGSTKIGKNCMIGGQVGIIGHLTIADGVKIAAQSGIGQSVKEDNAILQGSPAFDIGKYKRSYVGFRNLPKTQQKLADLEKEIIKFSNQK